MVINRDVCLISIVKKVLAITIIDIYICNFLNTDFQHLSSSKTVKFSFFKECSRAQKSRNAQKSLAPNSMIFSVSLNTILRCPGNIAALSSC